MTHDLRAARVANGLTQTQAGARLRVSQPYLAMLESGNRRLTPELARRVMKLYRLPPTVLLPSKMSSSRARDPRQVMTDVAVLGYPGFAHVRPARARAKNPGDVLLAALAQDNLEARVAEALPWLVFRYWDLGWPWLVREAKLHDLQNRLGFVVTLARRLAERAGHVWKLRPLSDLEDQLERSRLSREEPFGKASLSEVERTWLAANRTDDAMRWNLLTDWKVDDLRYRT